MKDAIKVIIVEDSVLVAADMANRLQAYGLEIMDTYTSGEQVLEALDKTTPDIIIMDIELAGALDGIGTASMINRLHKQIPIIYLSEYTDAKFVERAKQTFPANYLSKPFQESELIRAIEIAIANAEKARMERGSNDQTSPVKHIMLRTDNQKFIKLSLDEIIFLKAVRSYCDIITDRGKFTISKNMKGIYERIATEDFLRVNRSYVVNMKKVTELDGNTIKLGDQSVVMTNSYRDAFMSHWNFIR
ncbi:MAG: response regulator [Bacteroidota bacterium]